MKTGIVQTPWNHALLLKTGQTTVYSTGDNGTYQTGKTRSYVVLTTGQYSGTTSITINSKTDTHSNNCVFDQQTRLMWSRYVTAGVGPASDGLLPWTTTGSGGTAEGIFPFVTAANSAALAGFGDWRVPNILELLSLMSCTATSPGTDATAFPTMPANSYLWSSSSAPTSPTTFAKAQNTSFFVSLEPSKTVTRYLLLVRGGV